MDKDEDIAVAFRNYFIKLFTSSSPSQDDLIQCTEVLEPKVTESMNDYLNKSYTKEEDFKALQQMGPLKSPGLYGFGARFYQNHLETMGEDICNVVLKTLHSNGMNQSLNSSYLALIPKKKKPNFVSEYRPISLCNVLYKLVSKVISNRLKPIMHSTISLNQSAFIHVRLITDNILLANE